MRSIKDEDSLLIDECDSKILDNPLKFYKDLQSHWVKNKGCIMFFTATLGSTHVENEVVEQFATTVLNFEPIYKADIDDESMRYSCEHVITHGYEA